MRIKHLLILAATAGMALGCATNFEASPTQPAEIGFGSWGENLTKTARTEGGSTFDDGDHFFVYGHKTINTVDQIVFQSQEVTMENSLWGYSPKKFWDEGATSYTFFGVSRVAATDPTASANMSTSAMDGNLTSSSITLAGNNNDILVAEKKVVTKTGEPARFTHDVVLLNFHHIGSLVDMYVKKAPNLEGSTVAITHVALLNIKNAGTYSVAYADGTATYKDEENNNVQENHPVVTWTPTSGVSFGFPAEDGYTTFPSSNVSSLPSNVILSSCSTDVETGDHISNGSTLISNLVVMPQNLSPISDVPTLEISYTITTPVTTGDNPVNEVMTVNKAQIALNLFDKTDFDQAPANSNDAPFITNWWQGKHYSYYLTIDANAITFNAAITDWTNVKGYHYLVD